MYIPKIVVFFVILCELCELVLKGRNVATKSTMYIFKDRGIRRGSCELCDLPQIIKQSIQLKVT